MAIQRNRPNAAAKTLSLPFKQKQVIYFRPRLAPLLRRYPRAVVSFADKALEVNLADVLQGVGFAVRPLVARSEASLAGEVAAAVADGNLILIHYRPIAADGSPLLFFRAVRRVVPAAGMGGVVPVFFAARSDEREREALRTVAAFGVRHALFPPVGASVERSLEEMLQGLRRWPVAAGDETLVEDPPTGFDETDTTDIERYKTLLIRGESLYAGGDPEAAVATFTDAIAADPSFTALIRRGDAYFALKNYTAALSDYREAKRLEMSRPLPYARMGACLFSLTRSALDADDGARAEELFGRGLAAIGKATDLIGDREASPYPEDHLPNPYGAVVSALLAADFGEHRPVDADRRLADAGERVVGFDKTAACRLDAETFADCRDKAILLARLGYFAEAESILERFERTPPPGLWSARHRLAKEYALHRRFEEAWRTVGRVIGEAPGLRPDVAPDLRRFGRIHALALREERELDRAIDVYRDVLSIGGGSTDDEWILLDMAGAYLEKGERGKAASILVEAAFRNPALFDDDRFARYEALKPLAAEIVDRFTRR